MTNKINLVILSTLLVFSCLFGVSSCKDAKEEPIEEPSLEVSATEFQVESAGATLTLEITTDQTWEATSSEQWCTVSPNRGRGSSEVKIYVKAYTNMTEPRTATIEVKSPTLTKTITVTQQLKIDKRKRDSLALHDLYSMLPFATPNAAWDPAKPFSTWVGTGTDVVDGELRVISFVLNDAIFAWDGSPLEYGSTLKPSIGDMDEIKSLNISYGHIYGPLPEEIGKLTKLQIFKAEENCFEGPLPSTMAAWKQIKSVVLQHNYFTGDLPAFIGDWTELQELNISHNGFANIPDCFEKLQKLESLDMSVQCTFDEQTGMVPIYPSENRFPQSLTKLPNIQTILINNINMVGELPANLGDMKGLIVLSVNENKLTGGIPTSISSCENLKNLDVSKNQLSGSIPANMDKCTRLYSVWLAENNFSGSIPAELGKCAELRSLMFEHNKLTGTIPVDLFKAVMMTEMSFAYNELEGAIPEEIGNMYYLNQFDAEYNKFTTFPSTIGKLANIEQIQLHGNNITSLPDIASSSVTSLRRLEYIDLRDNNIEGAIPGFFGSIYTLKLLMLSGNRFVGDIPENLLNHRNAGGFFFKANICPQQTGHGFTSCPDVPWTEEPGAGEGGILG